MNAQLCQAQGLCVDRVEVSWFGGRVVAATTGAARAAYETFQSVWREGARENDRARSYELMVDVNDRTLKDIGAPEWMIARANERRHSHYIHLLELFRS